DGTQCLSIGRVDASRGAESRGARLTSWTIPDQTKARFSWLERAALDARRSIQASDGERSSLMWRRWIVRRWRSWSVVAVFLGLLLAPTPSAGQATPPYVTSDPCPEPNNTVGAACQLSQPNAMGTTIKGLFN